MASATSASASSNRRMLTVVACTPMHKDSDPSKPILGYKTTLEYKDEVVTVTPFGTNKRPVIETYYMDFEDPCELGFSAELDLDDFIIKEVPFEITRGKNVGKTITLKYLIPQA